MSNRKHVRFSAALVFALVTPSALTFPVVPAVAQSGMATPASAEALIRLKQADEALRNQISTIQIRKTYCPAEYAAVKAQLDAWKAAAASISAERATQRGMLVKATAVTRTYTDRMGRDVNTSNLAGPGVALPQINAKLAQFASARPVPCVTNQTALNVPSTRTVGQSLSVEKSPSAPRNSTTNAASSAR